MRASFPVATRPVCLFEVGTASGVLSVGDGKVRFMDITAIIIICLVGVACLVVGILLGRRAAAREHGNLRDELKALSAQAVSDSRQQVMDLADSRVQATEKVISPVRDTLERLNQRLGTMETQSASWQSQLKQQVESVRLSGSELRRETQALAEALRRPQVRGNWGELQLKRSLELAGLTERCTFEEQVSTRTDDGLQRPDVVVQMPGEKSVVIDSKAPLDAFLSATAVSDADERDHHLARHAKQVRGHVDTLASKRYWEQLAPAPEFVVLFLPGEAIFAQAAETDPGLLDYAAGKKVMIATPTTLIAMLKTVAYAWTQEALAENAREVQQLGKELYDRLSTVGGHLDKLGRNLSTAVGTYNKAVGSMESRVLVSARKMRDLQVVDSDLDTPTSVTDVPRPLTAPELVTSDDDEQPAIEGEPGREQWRRHAVGE